jgi:hypothetical protein
MVKVFHFRVYNAATDEVLIPPRKSTVERIKQIGGEIIEATGEDVPESSLDDYGRFDPNA